ncbi:MAG: hypothetical protein K2Y08_00180 [Alphaproteobacteria bacterium]|nr:hypothetical protein [Alphaproteobacteria bacterium]
MKIIFKSFFLLHCSVSSCFAGIGQEFLQELGSRVSMLRTIEKEKTTLLDKDPRAYLAKGRPSQKDIDDVKLSFASIKVVMELELRNFLNRGEQLTSCESSADLSTMISYHYSRSLGIIEKLYAHMKCFPKSTYAEDLKKCIEIANFFPNYLTSIDKDIAEHLTVESGYDAKLKEIRLAVYFNAKDYALSTKRKAICTLSKLNKIDVEKLSLPPIYKEHLQEAIEGNILTIKMLLRYANETINRFPKGLYAPMAVYKDYSLEGINHKELDELRRIVRARHFIDPTYTFASNPFSEKFSIESTEEEISLSAEEQIRSLEHLNKILEEEEELAWRELLIPHPSTAKMSTRKNQHGKKKKARKKGFKKSQKGRISATLGNMSSSLLTAENTEERAYEAASRTSSSSSAASRSCDAETPENIGEAVTALGHSERSHDDLVVERNACEIESNMSSSSSSTASPSVASGFCDASSSSCEAETRESVSENISFVDQWLTDIINTSYSKNNAFMIFQKAIRLKSQLAKNHDLLEQTQEAAASLAISLQGLKTVGPSRCSSHKVPQKLESFFYYLMESPISCLKGLRFRRIETFFNILGIKIDKGAAGSRIHFSFRDHETSIHLHDKHNGELDGGRISSLRKFLIDCGFTYSE